MYADTITDSMRRAIDETERRRRLQQQYNEEHGITPTTIKKAVRDLIAISKAAEADPKAQEKDLESMDARELNKLQKELQKKMHKAAAELNFEEAAQLRDRMLEVKKMHNGQRGAECVPVGKGALNIGFGQRPESNKRRRDRYDHI